MTYRGAEAQLRILLISALRGGMCVDLYSGLFIPNNMTHFYCNFFLPQSLSARYNETYYLWSTPALESYNLQSATIPTELSRF
jgi:hypothetical protein